jgi:hypothetical protein
LRNCFGVPEWSNPKIFFFVLLKCENTVQKNVNASNWPPSSATTLSPTRTMVIDDTHCAWFFLIGEIIIWWAVHWMHFASIDKNIANKTSLL